jgi:hypothetical protein
LKDSANKLDRSSASTKEQFMGRFEQFNGTLGPTTDRHLWSVASLARPFTVRE